MASSVIPVRRLEDRARLDPAARRSRIAAVPGEEAELVAGGPAVAGRVGQEGLAAVVHGRGALLDRRADGLPRGGRLREHLGGADAAGRVERRDAQRLQAVAHARVDEVVARREAQDRAVDAPRVAELGQVAPAVPGGGAACGALSVVCARCIRFEAYP